MFAVRSLCEQLTRKTEKIILPHQRFPTARKSLSQGEARAHKRLDPHAALSSL